MFHGRTEIRVSATSNALDVSADILREHAEGHAVVLVYLGAGALAQAMKAVRKANAASGGPKAAFLVFPGMQRKVVENGQAWYVGSLALLTRETAYAEDQEPGTRVEAGSQ